MSKPHHTPPAAYGAADTGDGPDPVAAAIRARAEATARELALEQSRRRDLADLAEACQASIQQVNLVLRDWATATGILSRSAEDAASEFVGPIVAAVNAAAGAIMALPGNANRLGKVDHDAEFQTYSEPCRRGQTPAEVNADRHHYDFAQHLVDKALAGTIDVRDVGPCLTDPVLRGTVNWVRILLEGLAGEMQLYLRPVAPRESGPDAGEAAGPPVVGSADAAVTSGAWPVSGDRLITVASRPAGAFSADPSITEKVRALPTDKVPGAVSLTALATRLGASQFQSELDNDPDVLVLRPLALRVLGATAFTSDTVRSLIGWLMNEGLTQPQATHLPVADAVSLLRWYGDRRVTASMLPADHGWRQTEPTDGLAGTSGEPVAASPVAADPTLGPGASRPRRRSTSRGDARVKIVAALNTHHQYSYGRCLSTPYAGCNELARLAGVAVSSVSRFFSRQFNGHDKYRSACEDGSIHLSLKLINGDLAPSMLFENVPGERRRRDEE